MKNAIYDKNGRKIAGDSQLPEKLSERILSAALPLRENDCLYSCTDDGNISLINAPDKLLSAFNISSLQRMTRAEFLRGLLLGVLGEDIRAMCEKYDFKYDRERVLILVSCQSDISDILPEFEQAFCDDDNVTPITLDKTQIALLVSDQDGENAQLAQAVCSTFTEMGIEFYIGISCQCENASLLSACFEQALTAIEMGKKLSCGGGIWRFCDVLPEKIASLLPQEGIDELKEKAEQIRRRLDPETLALVQEFFKYDLNISETARNTFMHRNTLIYRLSRIQKETGFNLRNFDEAVALRMYIALNKVFR